MTLKTICIAACAALACLAVSAASASADFVVSAAGVASRGWSAFAAWFEGVLATAFPVAARVEPEPAEVAPLSIGLAAARSYEARRRQRIDANLPSGLGLSLAA